MKISRGRTWEQRVTNSRTFVNTNRWRSCGGSSRGGCRSGKRRCSSGSNFASSEALGAIAHNGSPQTFAHNHAYSRVRQVGTAGHEIEQRSWKPSAGFFDALDIAALLEKKQAVFRRARRGPHATRSGACAPSCGGEPGLCARASCSSVSGTRVRVSVSVSRAADM